MVEQNKQCVEIEQAKRGRGGQNRGSIQPGQTRNPEGRRKGLESPKWRENPNMCTDKYLVRVLLGLKPDAPDIAIQELFKRTNPLADILFDVVFHYLYFGPFWKAAQFFPTDVSSRTCRMFYYNLVSMLLKLEAMYPDIAQELYCTIQRWYKRKEAQKVSKHPVFCSWRAMIYPCSARQHTDRTTH